MEYKHKIVQGLATLLEMYGGKAGDPMMKAFWLGLRGQVPFILQSLDNNEEAITEMEAKLKEVIGTEDATEIKEELVGYFSRWNKDGSTTIRIPADSKMIALFPKDKTEEPE